MIIPHVIDNCVKRFEALERIDLSPAVGDAGKEQQIEREVSTPLARQRDRSIPDRPAPGGTPH